MDIARNSHDIEETMFFFFFGNESSFINVWLCEFGDETIFEYSLVVKEISTQGLIDDDALMQFVFEGILVDEIPKSNTFWCKK